MKIFAHRGSSLIWPENTLFAFDQAHQFGSTGFETDLRLSKDQEIILSHDDNLARFAHADKTLSHLTVPEISEIEISSADGKFADKIITLRQLLEKYPDKDYIFDCKISERLLFEKLRDLLIELTLHNRIWFLTWDAEGDSCVRELFPDSALFPRYNRTVVWAWASLVRLGTLCEPSNRILSLPAVHKGLTVFTRKQIARIKAQGRTFIGYLVNTKKAFQHCQACGVEYYLTDRPDLIANLGCVQK